jgi:8-oxo-dGTP diphosphatase
MKNKNEDQYTKVSVGIVIFKNEKILFGSSKDKNGNLKYILPVGHLKYMESFVECAKREVLEECGIKIKDVELQFVSNTDSYSPKHYVHIGLKARWLSGEPKVIEPGGILGWEWRSYDNIPENLSIGAALTIKALKESLIFFDIVE